MTQRGQVHVFGENAQAIAVQASRKMDPTPAAHP
jgi:hypothetical protein